MSSFIKQVFIVAIGIVLGSILLVGGCMMMVSTAIVLKTVDEVNEAEAEKKRIDDENAAQADGAGVGQRADLWVQDPANQ